MEIINNYTAGKMNRLNYIKYNIILIGIFLLIGTPVYIIAGEYSLAILSLLFIPTSFILDAKRFHDLGKGTSWAVALTAINLIGVLLSDGVLSNIISVTLFIAFLYLCIAKGTEGTNQFAVA